MRPWAVADRPRMVNGLWTVDQYKMTKGRKAGFHSIVLHLAPATSGGLRSGGRPFNVCPASTPECRELCLNTAGFGVRPIVQHRRVERTRWLLEERSGFVEALALDLELELNAADCAGMQLAVRPNGTSDLPWLALELADRFPSVQFYDYTKIPRPWSRARPNYHVTFSRAEDNWAACEEALDHGVNVAVVWNVHKSESLPSSYLGRRVVDGDLNDLRFLDPTGGVIVGLRAKGRARGRPGGFVLPAPALAVAA